MWKVCRALHVVRRRLQGVLRRRTAVEDVARLEGAVGGGVWPDEGWLEGGPGRGKVASKLIKGTRMVASQTMPASNAHRMPS